MTNETGKKPAPHKKHVARLEREKQQTRLILYTFYGILGLVVLLLVYGWLDASYLQLNRVVANVGGTKILVKEFEPRVRLRRQQLIDNYFLYQQYQQIYGMDLSAQLQSIDAEINAPETVGQAVLDEMIDDELIRLEAQKRGITVSKEELDARVEQEFGYFPNGSPTPSLTPTAFEAPTDPASLFKFITPTPEATEAPQSTAMPDSTSTPDAQPTPGDSTPAATATLEPTATLTLAPTVTATTGPTSTPLPTATPFTREGYEGVVADTNENLARYGFSADYYRNFFEVLILREKLKEIITADIGGSAEELRARHILVTDEAVAQDIIKRLQAGEDFADLARELSTDTGSGAQGGDLGWFGKGAMVPEFETAAFALETPGDFTLEPVQSQFGYHIIQLMAKREKPLNASELQDAKDTAFQEWLTSLRDGEYLVETFDIWQQRVPSEPSFISVATEAAGQSLTAQAEQAATLKAANATETPKP